MQEVDEFEVFADCEVGEEGLYHLFVGFEVLLVYLHHQDAQDQLELYLELLLCDFSFFHLREIAANDEVLHLGALDQINFIANKLENGL